MTTPLPPSIKAKRIGILDKRILNSTNVATLLLSVLTFFVALVWLFTDWQRLEPLATLLGIMAVICGLVIDPLIAKRNERAEIIEAVSEEITANKKVISPLFTDPDFICESLQKGGLIYGRLMYSALERALISSVFSSDMDRELRTVMTAARINFESANAEFSIMEMVLLHNVDPEKRSAAHNEFVAGRDIAALQANLQTLSQAIEKA